MLDEGTADDEGPVSRSSHTEDDTVRDRKNSRLSLAERARAAGIEDMELPRLVSEDVHGSSTHDGVEMHKSAPRSWLGSRMALDIVSVRNQLLPKQASYYR